MTDIASHFLGVLQGKLKTSQNGFEIVFDNASAKDNEVSFFYILIK